MYSFETLLHASSDELLAIFSATRVGPLDDSDVRREQIAQQLGVKVPQLLCSVGFNAALPEHPGILNVLGFSAMAALEAERNYAFIHDIYHAISINNVIEIYAVLKRLPLEAERGADLVLSRITHLESQLEETINPILIGGYKLEVRAIYENDLASPEFVAGRLSPNHAVMRDMANENTVMLERGAIEAMAFLEAPGVSANEKRRALFQGLIPAAVAHRYIREVEPEEERQKYIDALESGNA